MSIPQRLNCSTSEIRKIFANNESLQFLSNTTLFKGFLSSLPLTLLELICSKSIIVPLPAKRVVKLPPPDSPDACLFEILEGYVKIYDRPKVPADKNTSNFRIPQALLAWRIPGELLGDFQYSVADLKLSDHIVTTDECKLLRVPVSVIESIGNVEPRIHRNIATNLAHKAIKARVRAQILRLPNIKCKMAQLFLELLEERETDPLYNNLINGTFRTADLGAFLGCGERTASEGLSALIHKKFVEHHLHNTSGRFIVSDKKALQTFLRDEWVRSKTEQKDEND